LKIAFEKWSFDADLQIIIADVYFSIHGDVLVDEPLCIDVGLPALLLSGIQDVSPNRWALPEEWQKMPFFVCGCGDPECRGYSFLIRHISQKEISITEVEERSGDSYRFGEQYVISRAEYRKQVSEIGRQYIHFIEGLDYRPYYANTVSVVRELLAKLEVASRKM
jgi:hypothetical protein